MVDNENDLNNVYPATVVSVIDKYTVVINRGSLHGVKKGQRFIIYDLSNEPIKDPTNEEILGYLEYVKGRGKVVHVQEKMSTIESDEEDEVKTKRRDQWSNSPEEIIEIKCEKKKFKDAYKGDKAKPV